MLTIEQLQKANEILSEIDDLKDILNAMDSKYVETTIGLVDVNSSSKHKTQPCEKATLFHQRNPEIEKELKSRAWALISQKIARLKADLSEYVES